MTTNKPVLPETNSLNQDTDYKLSLNGASGIAVAASAWRAIDRVRELMPYEAAAKAIYVRANGLRAYRSATGTAGLAAESRHPEGGRRRTDLKTRNPVTVLAAPPRTAGT
jgi:hypothetical protein